MRISFFFDELKKTRYLDKPLYLQMAEYRDKKKGVLL